MLAPPIRGGELRLNARNISIFTSVVILSNFLTFTLLKTDIGSVKPAPEIQKSSLYLMDKASRFVFDTEGFEKGVRDVSQKLSIPPEWLMAVMYAESRFDASALNHRGSGATGLIQFMPLTAGELNTTVEAIRLMDHVDQLQLVYLYLNQVRRRYGEFKSLTELYLGILYPKALDQDYCYTMYAKPSKMYRQNIGLDENKDGVVTVSDIDKRMQRIFPTAYLAGSVSGNEEEGFIPRWFSEEYE